MMQQMKLFNRFHLPNSGFTLLETLLALFCISLSMLILVPCVQTMKRYSYDQRIGDDHIAIRQLQLMLAQAYTFSLMSDSLAFQYRGDEYTLEYDRNRLVKRPGYEIFLEDIDSVTFFSKSNCYFVTWERGKQFYESILSCE